MTEYIPQLQNELQNQMAARRTRANATNENLNKFEVQTRRDLSKIQNFIKSKFADLFGESAVLTVERLNSISRLKALSNKLSHDGYKVMQSIDESHFDDYQSAVCYVVGELSNRCREVLITPPLDFDDKTTAAEYETAVLKLVDPNWYMKRFMKMRAQYREYCQIAMGRVGGAKGQHKYVSKGAFNAWKENQRKMQDYVKSMALYDEKTGELIDLETAINSSTANPENRRVEMMVRARGFEELAVERGYVGVFITWTLPSRYHKNSGKWDGSDVKDGQAELMNQWAKARARIAKHDIDYFGFRVAEPHKDATPHAHYFLFVSEENKGKLLSHLSAVARQLDSEELTTKDKKEARFLAKIADPSKGGATAYIAKYISKNINGSYISDEVVINPETGKPEKRPISEIEAEQGAFCVRAWASLYNIRQFQQFGGAKVSLWRACRKLKPEQTKGDPRLETLRECASESRWSAFCKVAQNISLAYEESQNQYNETIKKVIGFEWLAGVIRTAREAGLVLLPTRQAEALKEARSGDPWSTLNNCNQGVNIQSEVKKITAYGDSEAAEIAQDLINGKILKLDSGQVVKIRRNQILMA